ncbi:zinc-dependent alcohol dehydrogenase [Pseudovibrio sp. SCP19]|uniref:zinc-dependent alcohol dehydrogenase n=1 Tax=Pseudovibrio sp. SCP19 TaxID=3141374 RepID=UPI00333CDB91
MSEIARALWYTAPQTIEIREEKLSKSSGNRVYLKTHASAISRGTEAIVFSGDVPVSERERMTAPFQEGTFPFPVKYGYANVSEVAETTGDLRAGQRVFSLYPHQSNFLLSAEALYPIPEDLPSTRATLAANMETALNIIWDAGILPCSRVAVVGTGTVGSLVGYLCARIAGVRVTMIDVNPKRQDIADEFSCSFALPEVAPENQDVVVHCSASESGLNTAIRIAGREAKIVEASWYGSRPSGLVLGGSFHSQRLSLVSSQVGQVAPVMRPRWTHRRRMEAAISLLKDEVLDTLLAPAIEFEKAPHDLKDVLSGKKDTLCQPIVYS